MNDRITMDQSWKNMVFPSDYTNPVPKEKYHLVVIGAGPAGLITAIGAAGLGAKVALIEAHAMGGDCLNVGCVPSKALLHASKKVKAGKLDTKQAFDWAHEVRTEIAHHDSVERYTEAGVDDFLGEGKFTSDNEVQVGDSKLHAKAFIIATGSQPFVPPIPGLLESKPHTNETIFDLEQAPKSLGILGAGPIGCEMAQAFADLGTEVHVFEMAPQVLPRETPKAAGLVQASLEEKGVTFHTGAPVNKISGSGKYTINTDEKSYEVEEILTAIGRKANFENLGLENTSVTTHDRGITVDNYFRTTCSHIYAIGDVSSSYQFTNYADAQARAVIQNALFPGNKKTNPDILPMCTYTNPEIAHIGLTVPEAEQKNIDIDVYTFDFGELDRGRTDNERVGYAEVVTVKGKDKILGATIVGIDAGEQIAPISIMMSNKIGLGDLGSTMFCYPSRSEYLKRLSDNFNRTKLTPTVAGAMKKWLSWSL